MYCTRDELIDHVGGSVRAAKLTAESGDTPDNTQIDKAVAFASQQIDLYLAKKYGSPLPAAVLTASAGLLRGWALSLGTWFLHSLRPPAPPDVMANYSHTIARLKDIRDDEADLPHEGAGSGGHTPQVDSPDRVFGRDETGGL